MWIDTRCVHHNHRTLVLHLRFKNILISLLYFRTSLKSEQMFSTSRKLRCASTKQVNSLFKKNNWEIEITIYINAEVPRRTQMKKKSCFCCFMIFCLCWRYNYRYLVEELRNIQFLQTCFLPPTAQKMKFSIKDFFSKCDIKSLMENFIFCAVTFVLYFIFELLFSWSFGIF